MARPKFLYHAVESLPTFYNKLYNISEPFRGLVLVLWRISGSVSAIQGSLQMFTLCIRVHGFPPFPALEEPLMPHRAGWPEPAWLGLEFSSLGIGRPDRPGTRDAEAGSLNLKKKERKMKNVEVSLRSFQNVENPPARQCGKCGRITTFRASL